jgi:uncharacterized membrane protein
LQDRKCSLNDLSNLSDEDIINFKELFFDNRVSKFHKGTGKMMETLYDYFIDILNKRVPVDGTNVKVDQIINKVKLVEIPEDVILETIHETVEVERDGQKFEEKVERKRNTNEKGVILLKVNQHEEEVEVIVNVPGEGKKI